MPYDNGTKENNDMKKIGIIALLFASMSLVSCDLFEMDNYESPSETIHGAVVDAETGDVKSECRTIMVGFDVELQRSAPLEVEWIEALNNFEQRNLQQL